MNEIYLCASSGIFNNEALRATLGKDVKIYKNFYKPLRYDYVISWGYKKSYNKAKKISIKKNIPICFVEEGFIKSLPVYHSVCLSILIDYKAPYYDCFQESDLEYTIKNSLLTEADKQRSKNIMNFIVNNRITKYNDNNKVYKKYSGAVLLVDQTADDASIKYGDATEVDFYKMVNDALSQFKPQDISLKIHPKVISGERESYILDYARSKGIKIISENISPWDLFPGFSDIYVVTSQMGFEALISGAQVTCFGSPFYSGWGLTNDKKIVGRRVGFSFDLLHLFYCCYVIYPKYYNPFTSENADMENILLLILKKNQVSKLPEFNYNFLSSKKKFFINKYVDFCKESKINLTWGLDKTIKDSYFVEDGFIRSRGLGVMHNYPFSLIIDSQGLYFDKDTSCDLDSILNSNIPDDPLLLSMAAMLINKIVGHNLTKYNIPKKGFKLDSSEKNILLVIGQVEDDLSIKYGAVDVTKNSELLSLIRSENKDAYIIYKPHPDVFHGKRISEYIDPNLYDFNAGQYSIEEIYPHINSLHTITSLSGFEAIIRKIPVYTYGLPFYAGWGLTTDRYEFPETRRTKKLTVENLFIGSYMVYPYYLCPYTLQSVDLDTFLINFIKCSNINRSALVNKFNNLLRIIK